MLAHTYPPALALILTQNCCFFFLNSESKVSLGQLLLLALLSDPTVPWSGIWAAAPARIYRKLSFSTFLILPCPGHPAICEGQRRNMARGPMSQGCVLAPELPRPWLITKSAAH